MTAITNSSVPLKQLNIFTSQYDLCFTGKLKSTCTFINANQFNKNEAWIEIKEVLLKHFLPDNYNKLTLIRTQLVKLKQTIGGLEKAYDDTITGLDLTEDIDEHTQNEYLSMLRNITERLKCAHEEYMQYNTAFHGIVNEHPLLASYSNIFVILYASLKELTKITGEITYSWKIFIKLIDMIIAKIIRDLTMNLKNKEEDSEHDSEDDERMSSPHKKRKKEKKNDREFTIDEEFFHSVIMPSIYSTIVAGIRQENISLFNLVFSFEIALKKTTVTRDDIDFFFNQFFKIPTHKDWRNHEKHFIDKNAIFEREKYNKLKTLILKNYPDTRKVFEIIDIQLGMSFTYKDLGSIIFKRILKGELKDEPLIKRINVALLCPNEDFKSLVCQFVHEELSTIFDFTEDLTKLHNFIKTASWSLPVALFTSNSINIVNTVCSIASYYGVGLEVLRTDFQQSIKRMEHYEESKQIDLNIVSNVVPFTRAKLTNDAAGCYKEDLLAGDPFTDKMMYQKQQLKDGYAKDELDIDDKQASQNQSSLQLIEKCAENGTWVLISTLKFPSFWYKVSNLLADMQERGKVVNTFRLFFDLQGYSLKEIPENFLFDHCVKFYLTEKNNEDMEGFNDVWANILNDDILNAKDLMNVPILEQPSDLKRINLNLESNIIEASMESLRPHLSNKDVPIKPGEKILDKLQEELKDDTIILPLRLNESDIHTGNDLMHMRSDITPIKKNATPNISSIVQESDMDSVESKIENLWHHMQPPKRKKK